MPQPEPPLIEDGAQELADYLAGDPATMLAYATGLVRGYCGWHIAPSRDEVFIVDGNGHRDLWLPTLYLTDVFYVSDDGATVDLADIDWWRYGRLRRYDALPSTGSGYSCWTPRQRAVEAEVRHGYDETPTDVRAALVSLAARMSLTPTSGV